MRVLAGDLGGTHARFAVVEVEPAGGQRGQRARARVMRDATLSSRDAPGLAALARGFLEVVGEPPPSRACFGVAGPVRDGEAHTTNLPWSINARAVGEAIGIPHTSLINDFEAVGHGLLLLQDSDLVTLQPGEPPEHGPIAVIGAGTGLGEGYLVWDRSVYRVHSSEGGHATFAAQGPIEWQLCAYLAERFGHVSYERVLSGPGLVNIYQYLAAAAEAAPAAPMLEEMRREDPAAVISRHGLAGSDPLAVSALDLFVSVYGAQAGNLALTILASGGVYLAGGIAPRVVEKLKSGAFLSAFRRKGRLSELLARVPVHVIMNPDVGLLGAAAVAAADR